MFGGLTETDLVRDIQKVVRCEVTPNATIQVGEVDVSVAGPVVQTLRLNDRGELDVLVTVVKHMNRTVMRQSYSYPIIAEVALRVHLNRKDRLVEAYAGDANARTALLGFLRSAFGLHSVSAARKSEAVRPVGFSVRRVDQMATDQGFRLLSVLCPPKSGAKYLDGRLATRVNRLRVPLPDEERTRELTSEHNSFRSYQFTFRHPDGFEEISEVDFDFRNASHPAIGFPIRTSRPAMRSAITPLV